LVVATNTVLSKLYDSATRLLASVSLRIHDILHLVTNVLFIQSTVLASTLSVEAIKGILATYARSQFRKDFGFEYNGDRTKPPNLYPGAQAQGVSAFLFIKNGTQDALRKSANSNIVQYGLPVYRYHLTAHDVCRRISFPTWAEGK
jgi:hypothetical protein